MPATKDTRHAVSRSTGATTWTRKEGDQWKTTCLNHKTETTAPNRGAAWKNGSTPAQFCPKCRAITEGKADKLLGGLLDLPTPTPAKKRSKSTPKKPVAKRAEPDSTEMA
ncbi:hypothetical protein QWJ41_19750 [Nocardioides sp. SOB44]|uniref:DUF3039 domain-containing protein n=2 Tax=Nocardioides cremeus TaxID=3058044 RepID=A0ABT8U049_9ACTN|nr:hypothetical protein [Nocardioides cremeus]